MEIEKILRRIEYAEFRLENIESRLRKLEGR